MVKKYKFTPEEEKDFQKLVQDVLKIIEEAKAKGIDIRFLRHDLYTCKFCGAYENETFQGERFTALPNGRRSRRKEFITIERKDRSYHRAHMVYCTTHYRFICGACGKLQKQTFKERFDNRELYGEENNEHGA